jgi:muconolactone D-isomerase
LRQVTTPEFLVRIDLEATDVEESALSDLRAREEARASELAFSGHLVRLWRVPNRWANVGVWRAHDEAELLQTLRTLPLHPYMTISIERLDPHPSDPRASPSHTGGEGGPW